MTLPLYSVDDIRAIERAAFAAASSFTFMQQAGAAIAAAAQTMQPTPAPILAIAGGGNNGGDALVAATLLHQAGYPVRVLNTHPPDRLPPDAARARHLWQQQAAPPTTPQQETPLVLPPADLILDGVFGIGLSRPPQDKALAIINAINAHPAPVLAIDIPSGLNADTGTATSAAVRAAVTVTFFGAKTGLYTGAGPDHCGKIQIVPLDAPPHPPAAGRLLNAAPPLHRLRRRRDSHKGTYGTLALIGGARGMQGALLLAARAAARLGAGKLIARPLHQGIDFDFMHPEIMWQNAATPLSSSPTCLAAGMGMGVTPTAAAHLKNALATDLPLLIDADGLLLLAKNADKWQKILHHRRAALILTPHPGEAARLWASDYTAGDINADRPTAARRLAKKWRATVVLKGAGTVIAAPAGSYKICAAGNPGLARGGSGDVLTGIIAALLCQTHDPEFAACAGVWLHATAADRLSAPHGELALDINDLAKTAAQIAAETTK